MCAAAAPRQPYNQGVARGWESKSVAEQQGQAERDGTGKSTAPEDVKLAQRRRALELSILRVKHQLDASSHPNHRAMLERALADLTADLAKLNATAPQP
jgi:hypothetical protein